MMQRWLTFLLMSSTWCSTSSTEWVKGIEAKPFSQLNWSESFSHWASDWPTNGDAPAAQRCRWNKVTKRKVCDNEAPLGSGTSVESSKKSQDASSVEVSDGTLRGSDEISDKKPAQSQALGWRPWKEKKSVKEAKSTPEAKDDHLEEAASSTKMPAGKNLRGHAARAAATAAALAAATSTCEGLAHDGTSVLPPANAVRFFLGSSAK